MRKLTSLLLSLLIALSVLMPYDSFADKGSGAESKSSDVVAEKKIPEKRLKPRLVDRAGLLTKGEASELKKKLDSISKKERLDVAVVTIKSLKGKRPEAYADDFYDYNGYGYGENKDGILLLLSMDDRKWHITTTGFGITAFTDAGLDFISDKVLPDIKDENYKEAFSNYAHWAQVFTEEARENAPFDKGHMPKEKLKKIWILYDLIIGLVLMLAVAAFKARKMKSIVQQHSAENYTRPGSMVITSRQDRFINCTTTSVKIESSSGSSTHSGSSGSSHGGRGGSF